MFQHNLLTIILSLVISINLSQGVDRIYLNLKQHLILRYELLSDPVQTVKDFCSNKNSETNNLLSSFFKISCTINIYWKDELNNICDSIYNYTPSADRYWIITTKCGIKNIVFFNVKSSILR